MESITLEKLAKAIGGETLGEESFVISSIEDSSLCSNIGVCYLKDKQYLAKLSTNP